DKIDIAYRLIKAVLFKGASPLAVAWSLTNKCNLNCIYCGHHALDPGPELKTTEIFSIIDDLKLLGTKMISFTGGEPLLREDIKEIVDYTYKSGIRAGINTNGVLFKEKIEALNNLRSINFSLDGPEEINDFLRGKGVFKKVIESIKIALEKGMRVSIVTVLNKYNLSCVDYLVGLAKESGITVLFQPVTKTLLRTEIDNPHVPEEGEYKKAIDRIIELKKQNKPVSNTFRGLIYLRNWPKGSKVTCYGKNISCKIEADGYLCRCGRDRNKDRALYCPAGGLEKSFKKLTLVSCNDCWCALRLEANYIASFDIGVILSHYQAINGT
ncbi:MAG: radical SAM protein, partial [Candidatus Omnitrophica bacterium]|nr:radical SAM protein [Candidatus Omnitrophota bacterium]